MYLLAMDQLTKDDINAAAAAHHELGPHFDGAVAESLVERIGEEIDKRVDARLGQPRARRDRIARPATRGEVNAAVPAWAPVALALGSMGIGIGATAAVLNMSIHHYSDGATTNAIAPGQIALCVLIWIVVGVINVSYNRRH
jgi:hypothetical protein